MKIPFYKRLLCGCGIGFAFIVPGISGSAIAMILGIYEQMISAVSEIFRDFKKNFLFLLPILLGAAIAIAAMYFPITWALKKDAFTVIMLFAGFIVGGMRPMIKGAKFGSAKKKYYLFFGLTFLFVIALSCLKFVVGADVDLIGKVQPKHYAMIFFVGIIFAVSVVLPGVSGATLLLAVGYYKPVFTLAKTIIKELMHGKIVFSRYILVLLLLAGAVIGILAMAKVMKKGFEKYPEATYIAVCGLAIGSVPAIFISQEWAGVNFGALHITLGILAFLIGAVATFYLTRLQEKKSELIIDNMDN